MNSIPSNFHREKIVIVLGGSPIRSSCGLFPRLFARIAAGGRRKKRNFRQLVGKRSCQATRDVPNKGKKMQCLLGKRSGFTWRPRKKGELDSASRFLTDKARKASSSWEQSVNFDGEAGELVVGGASIENDFAEVPVTVSKPDEDGESETMKFRLRKNRRPIGNLRGGYIPGGLQRICFGFRKTGRIRQSIPTRTSLRSTRTFSTSTTLKSRPTIFRRN